MDDGWFLTALIVLIIPFGIFRVTAWWFGCRRVVVERVNIAVVAAVTLLVIVLAISHLPRP